MTKNDIDVERLKEQISKQQEMIEGLGEQMKEMSRVVPQQRRRQILKAGGAAGLVALGAAGGAAADPGDDGETVWGTEQNRDSYYADEIDANSVSTDNITIRVGDGSDLQSIIDAAPAGARIVGDPTETLRVDGLTVSTEGLSFEHLDLELSDDANSHVIHIQADDVDVEHCTINARRDAQSDDHVDGIKFDAVSGGSAENCYVTTTGRHCINAGVADSEDNPAGEETTDIVISECHVNDFGDDGITTHYSSNIRITECLATNSAETFVSGDSSHGYEFDDGTDGATVENSTARNCTRGFVVQGHGTGRPPAINITVADCLAVGCGTGVYITVADSDTAGVTPKNVTFDSVSTKGSEQNSYDINSHENIEISGGYMEPASSATNAIRVDTNDVRIDDVGVVAPDANNTIVILSESARISNSNIRGSRVLVHGNGLQMTDSLVKNSSGTAVRIENGAEEWAISDSRFVDNTYGVVVESGVLGPCAVRDNFFARNGNYDVSVRADGTVDRILVESNHLDVGVQTLNSGGDATFRDNLPAASP